ncbi:MAG: L-threonylcarbamoyladenylate synthase [Candidatus Anstonellales archaeon]
MEISISNYDEAFRESKRVLLAGGVLVYPTDTVYGIGGDASRPETIKRVETIKRRKEGKPFSILLGSVSIVRSYCKTEEQFSYCMRYLPGPFTFIVGDHNSKVGIRVPVHSFMMRLSQELGIGIITTSANTSGNKAPCTLQEVEERIKKEADLAIDGGRTMYCMPSAVVDLVEKKVIREGPEPFEF